MNALVAEWVQKAEGDFNTALRELRARRAPNYDASCFHAQQCAEKYLKGFLVSQDIEPPRTHNLVALLKLCVSRDGSFELIRPALELLNIFAVDVRYPGEFSTREEARDAVNAARQVQEFARSRVKGVA
jgi:HEPN domain-containing protein